MIYYIGRKTVYKKKGVWYIGRKKGDIENKEGKDFH